MDCKFNFFFNLIVIVVKTVRVKAKCPNNNFFHTANCLANIDGAQWNLQQAWTMPMLDHFQWQFEFSRLRTVFEFFFTFVSLLWSIAIHALFMCTHRANLWAPSFLKQCRRRGLDLSRLFVVVAFFSSLLKIWIHNNNNNNKNSTLDSLVQKVSLFSESFFFCVCVVFFPSSSIPSIARYLVRYAEHFCK